MNTSLIITGIIMAAILILPILFLTGKSDKRRLLKKLKSEAKKKGLLLSNSDTWSSSALGIDEKRNVIIFIDEGSEPEINTSFSLDEVKSFRTIPVLSGKKLKNFDYYGESRLGLNFTFNDSSRTDLQIIFFSAGRDKITDTGHLFEKWVTIIMPKMR